MNSTDCQDAVSMRNIDYHWPGDQNFTIKLEKLGISRGKRVLLLGESGSGKSTLLSLMTGIISPAHGTVRILEQNINDLTSAARDRFRAEHFGIVFQMFNLLPYGSVMDNVILPLSFAPGRKSRACAQGGEQEEARRLLDGLGLDESVHTKKSAALSIGQQQRVAVARALIGSPEIIVADEPTSALDTNRRQKFIDLLFSQLEMSGATLIMVSHDESLGESFDQVLPIQDILTTRNREEG